MKKSLIALAVLATAGVASAQSSVTLFGVVDATLAHGSGSVSSKTQLTNSGYNSSRLGFRGTEDLGGGMSASFWLEAALNNDNGTGVATNTNNQATGGALAGIGGGQGLVFNRRSTVSLSGSWGELRLGRDYTPQFWNLAVYDPFNTNGVGTTVQQRAAVLTGATLIRASNSVGYFLPRDLGGFYGQAQYYMGENASNVANPHDGTGYGVRFGYTSGPVDVALALSKTSNLVGGDIKQNNVGVRYDFGVAQLMAQYDWDTGPVGGVSHKGKGWLIGGLIPVGAGQIRVSYSTWDLDIAPDSKSKQLALGYVYNLSKRTALYATYAHVSNSSGANFALNGSTTALGASSSGYDFGIRHSF
jgi:predicted porin